MPRRTTLLLFALLTGTLSPGGFARQRSDVAPPDSVPAHSFASLRLDRGTIDVEQYSLENGALTRVTKSYEADFGTLPVPERRELQGSRRIELPIVRIRATGDHPGAPIFWFEGGPGQSNMDTFDFDYFIEDHDHVMIGYRGVDGSVSLDCPEVTDRLRQVDDVLADETLRQVGDAYAACQARLRQAGVDIDGYTTVDVVADMESARRALGYERINILAESFGTRLAYLYGIMYPERIHRTIMIGANPPGGMVWDPKQTDAILQHYSTLWANDPATRARTEDLASVLRTVNREMPRRWLFLPIHPGNVKASAFAMLFDRASAARVFDTYVAAADGDPSGLWLISFVAPYIFPEIVNWGDNASKAVSADYTPEVNDADTFMPEDAVMGAPLGRFLWGPGDRWPIEPIPEAYRRMQPSDVETLILSGSLDLSTPPENAALDLLPYLPNGRQVVFAEMGHIGDLWTLQPETTRRLLTSFLETGVPDMSDYRYEPMDFSVRWGFPLLAKLILAGSLLVLVLMGGLTWFTVRFVRRRRRRPAG